MSIFGPSGFDSTLSAITDVQNIRIQEARIALRRVMEFTRYSIDDVINEPIAKFRVRYYYKINRVVDRYLKEKERTQIAKAMADIWVMRP
ncbi:MAG: hypothetical protein M0Z50_10620 [Planctomycetia bacterium]|nr:hypothetical protein [Planctomycetia bacterium]